MKFLGPWFDRFREPAAGIAYALSRMSLLPVIGTLLLALGTEFLAKIALETDELTDRIGPLWLATAMFVLSGAAVFYAAARIDQKVSRAANKNESRRFLSDDAHEYVQALAIAVVTGAIGVIILLAGMGWFVC